EFHREMDALEMAACRFRKEIIGIGGSTAEYHRVEVLAQFFRRYIGADFAARDELYALLFQEPDAALDKLFVELHIRDAVHEQSTYSVGSLEYRDGVASSIQLCGSREAGRSRTDDGGLLAGAPGGRFRLNPALVKTLVDDGALDALDRDGRCIDAEYTRSLARRRANAAGELRKVVRLVQPLQGIAPQSAIDQVIPFRDEVVDRAARRHAADQVAGVAKRHTAIHAARALVTEQLLVGVAVEFAPVHDAFRGRFSHWQRARKLKKAC